MKLLLPKGFLLIFLSLTSLLPAFSATGKLNLKAGETNVVITGNTYQHLSMRASVAAIGFMQVNTAEGLFTSLNVAGFGNRNIEGEPALPVYRKLIEVPLGAQFSVSITHQHYIDIDLAQNGILTHVIPAQPPMSKSDDPDKLPFIYNQASYILNSFTDDPLVSVTHVGLMRALNLARIDISPVQYNPVTKMLRIYDELELDVVFVNADVIGTIKMKQSKSSPYFKSMCALVENYKPLEPTDEILTAPATYVIISDPMFQSTLQPFIQWKTKKGFKVIEGYTNNPAVGTTTTSIKGYLQGLYNSPPAGYTAPSFVLFVGDVAQIPAWSGSAGSHFTDLRYCEYTGDNLPEVYYGRFSATNLTQLQPQINKTLEYEKYLMPDPSFLGKVVMAAGADASYQTWSNGQINYGTETYFNAAHNILSYTYLQPEPSGGNYSQNIRNNVSNGVAFSNYTAHCSESGWADPSFLISHIPALTNQSKYGLMVGNCCLSCKFDVTCFAEEMLRAENKGTIGYIGGSNNTYWDEDYWWGSGFKTVVLHPAYDANHIGAYDGTFHDHGESVSDWFITQGQMVVCGNYAVEESGTTRKTYYWEIYHLMGDPSLMVYYSVPAPMTATYQSPLLIGTTSLTVNTEAYATVALSNSGVLLDAKLANAGGLATLSFPALSAPGYLDIVITKQNKQPYISTIQVIPASGPYVVYTTHTLSDPSPSGNNNGQMDFGETNLLSLSLKNVGIQAAPSVTATFSTIDTYITVTDNTENYGNINPDQTVTIPNGFVLNVANNIPDQHVVAFDLVAASGSNSWTSHFNITANAPVLGIGAMTVSDPSPGGNNNGILDPGETANLIIVTNNSGHALVGNVIGSLSIAGGSSPYLTLNATTSNLNTIAAGGFANASFSVTANASAPIGTPVGLVYSVTGGSSSQYSAQESKQVVIGLIPTYIMSSTTVNTCVGNFYDPGGASGNYSDNQDYTMVFNPGTPGNVLRFVFSSFLLESQTTCNYDYLKIYDGNSTSATLIGTYCGSNSPGTITASNSAGSVTFVFHSDVSLSYSGWAAAISCVSVAPTLAVTPSSRSVAATAGATSYTVTSNSTWTVSSNQSWCTVTPSGSGNGTITATYTQNTTPVSRVANITVTAATLPPVVVTITQNAPVLSITPANQSVASASGTTSFSVTSNSLWTTSSDQPWCTLTPSGSGNGSITATYSANLTSVERVATITVTVAGLAPVVVTVTQAVAPAPEFNYIIVNDIQTSDRTLEFDLFLLDTQPIIPFELSIIQSGILVSSGIVSGGVITASIVLGYSDLVPLQQPTIATWEGGTPDGCIKIAAKIGPGCGNGTIIGTNGFGTRICRVRLTNSVPFTASSHANMAFNFANTPYPTKVFQYFGTPCISNQKTTNSTNCFSLATNPLLNGPPSLFVSPSDQQVPSSSGSIPFGVSSNASWTAISNQSWCTVTPSGFGNGTITANYTENLDTSPRVANITVTVAGLTPVVVSVTQAGGILKTFNLTVFIEGLYTGLSAMHAAMDESNYHWGETIADKITIELHDGLNYSNIVYTATNVLLYTNGTASFTLPSFYNGNYYVTIRQRNHILTTTAFPVSFIPSPITYNFDTPAKAYGGNMLLMIDGKYVFYAGDVNQDGIIDGSDLSDIGNMNDLFATGYLSEDVNGDGLVDGSDLSITGNNNDLFVGAITP